MQGHSADACSLQNCFAEKGCAAPTDAASATGAVNDVVVQCELAVRARARDESPNRVSCLLTRSSAAQNGDEAQQCWGIVADMTPPDSALHERCAGLPGLPGARALLRRAGEARDSAAIARALHAPRAPGCAVARRHRAGTAIISAGRPCSAHGCAQRPGIVPCPTPTTFGARSDASALQRGEQEAAARRGGQAQEVPGHLLKQAARANTRSSERTAADSSQVCCVTPNPRYLSRRILSH